jgi:phenylalanyl-tRNA synthetase alpha chain
VAEGPPEAGTGLPLTPEQASHLRDLGAGPDILAWVFDTEAGRDEGFRQADRTLSDAARRALRAALAEGGRPRVELLAETLAGRLASAGLVQVSTPIIMSRARLERMGLDGDDELLGQVFWLDAKRCLRPMLAPHLYEYMLDLRKVAKGPFGIFEIGPCFRKESRGARHANEFTMLNLVEVGTPVEDRLDRLGALAALLMEAAGIRRYSLETVESSVYGQTVDVVDAAGLELASCSMGPHPLDRAWGFEGSWVGLGLGLERLAMSLAGLDRLSPVGRSLGRLLGLPTRL